MIFPLKNLSHTTHQHLALPKKKVIQNAYVKKGLAKRYGSSLDTFESKFSSNLYSVP